MKSHWHHHVGWETLVHYLPVGSVNFYTPKYRMCGRNIVPLVLIVSPRLFYQLPSGFLYCHRQNCLYRNKSMAYMFSIQNEKYYLRFQSIVVSVYYNFMYLFNDTKQKYFSKSSQLTSLFFCDRGRNDCCNKKNRNTKFGFVLMKQSKEVGQHFQQEFLSIP